MLQAWKVVVEIVFLEAWVAVPLAKVSFVVVGVVELALPLAEQVLGRGPTSPKVVLFAATVW